MQRREEALEEVLALRRPIGVCRPGSALCKQRRCQRPRCSFCRTASARTCRRSVSALSLLRRRLRQRATLMVVEALAAG